MRSKVLQIWQDICREKVLEATLVILFVSFNIVFYCTSTVFISYVIAFCPHYLYLTSLLYPSQPPTILLSLGRASLWSLMYSFCPIVHFIRQFQLIVNRLFSVLSLVAYGMVLPMWGKMQSSIWRIILCVIRLDQRFGSTFHHSMYAVLYMCL